MVRGGRFFFTVNGCRCCHISPGFVSLPRQQSSASCVLPVITAQRGIVRAEASEETFDPLPRRKMFLTLTNAVSSFSCFSFLCTTVATNREALLHQHPKLYSFRRSVEPEHCLQQSDCHSVFCWKDDGWFCSWKHRLSHLSLRGSLNRSVGHTDVCCALLRTGPLLQLKDMKLFRRSCFSAGWTLPYIYLFVYVFICIIYSYKCQSAYRISSFMVKLFTQQLRFGTWQ